MGNKVSMSTARKTHHPLTHLGRTVVRQARIQAKKAEKARRKACSR